MTRKEFIRQVMFENKRKFYKRIQKFSVTILKEKRNITHNDIEIEFVSKVGIRHTYSCRCGGFIS